MDTRTIHYEGARLEVLSFLADLWPHEMPLDKWPSFCGAGDGLGDDLIPETICGINVSCLCFDHDCSWQVCDGTLKQFLQSNSRLYRNARSLVMKKIPWYHRPQAEATCLLWLSGVTLLGFAIYELQSSFYQPKNPTDNPAIREKLHRLAMASLSYAS